MNVEETEIKGSAAIDLLSAKLPEIIKEKLESYKKDIQNSWPDEPSSYLKMNVEEFLEEILNDLRYDLDYSNISQTLGK